MAIVILKTNYGNITLDIDEVNTPITAQNFLNYVKNGFYSDTIFHRVIPGFMIQGGGLTQEMTQKSTIEKPIQNEAKHAEFNKRGTIAMARTSDPHSAGAQFFINTVDNDFLNFQSETVQGFGYCVFGKVTAGMDVVDAISKVNTVNRHGHQNVPENPVLITEATMAVELEATLDSAVSR